MNNIIIDYGFWCFVSGWFFGLLTAILYRIVSGQQRYTARIVLGDPIIVINEVVMSILTEDIKNTRFLLTLIAVGTCQQLVLAYL